jgi:transcriptional regulator with PAS, ATPase and Fis domain
MVPFLSSEDLERENDIICPFIQEEKCSQPNHNNTVTCFMNTNNRTSCCYYNYHKFFLLIKDSGPFKNCIEYVDTEPDNQNSFSKIYGSKMSPEDFSKTLCYFPQYNIPGDELVGFELVGKGLPEKCFFEHNGDKVDLPAIKDVNKLKPRPKLYAKSEHHLSKSKTDSTTSSSAFSKLIKIDAIKSKLPKDDFTSEQPVNASIHPVTLSFFADKSVDALLSLVISDDANEINNETKTLIEQALGSIHNEIYKRRQEFLEKWCMTLGERVDDICQKEIIVRSNGTDDDEKRQKEAKKKAMQFAFEAICEMAKILAVQESDGFPENVSKQFIYNPKKQPYGQISSYIEKYYVDNISSDRKEYVIEFCKKAEMYAEEFVASEGKLKGRLSAPTVRKLKAISRTSNPVNARILIQGEAGGGKGVTADDFHFYCMKRIAKEIKEIESNWDDKKKEIEALDDGPAKEIEQEKFEDDPYAYLIKHSKYLEKVENNLQEIFSLPAIYSEIRVGSDANFFLKQISNTGWWLWNRTSDENEGTQDPLKDALKQSMKSLSNAQKIIEDYKLPLEETRQRTTDKSDKVKLDKEKAKIDFITGEDTKKNLIKLYVELLRDKIKFEYSSKKPNWSFNFLQVNCGILGGENSELAEAIKRLFGKFGSHETARPGLFQTCSYMGGTLFLDEIADCPVRVQDNLLRPLEEGKVSRPGWETFDEKVDNIRIVGATFKDLFKLAQQYQETFPSGHPKGFRPDLLTRLTRNTPVAVSPVWHYFVPTKSVDVDFPSQFAFVCNNSWEVSTDFWRKVYFMVSEQIDEHVFKARHHIPAGPEGRRKFASKITMRLFKEVGNIARLNSEPEKPDENDPQKNSALVYLRRMLDYLLVETN